MKKVLLIGGAGYVGTELVQLLADKYKITVFDNLSTGSLKNVNNAAKFIQGTTLSISDLSALFKIGHYDSVIHLAASKAAGESMSDPSKYNTNNIIGTLNLINYCVKHGIKSFVFSSSAAVYGIPQYNPIDEFHSLNPNNYYGHTKLMIEDSLMWFSKLKDMRFAALRYFNAAGYNYKKKPYSLEKNPKNLIPVIMEVALGFRDRLHIFGNDYSTKDGTGVRDYIHVRDLVSAHLKAIDYIAEEKKNLIINLGSGKGQSVLDIIKKVREICNVSIKYDFKERRYGDSDIMIASSELAKDLISWESKYSDLDTIIKSTWAVYKSYKDQ